jgi:uncharacterized protein DUF4398
VVLLVAALGACGPIEYVNQVSRRADSAVEAARAVQADKYAPYEWTRATQYLHKAREEAAYADFQSANRFGRLAEEAAVKAREEAVRRAANPEGMQELGPLPETEKPGDASGGLAPLGGDDGEAEGDKP